MDGRTEHVFVDVIVFVWLCFVEHFSKGGSILGGPKACVALCPCVYTTCNDKGPYCLSWDEIKLPEMYVKLERSI